MCPGRKGHGQHLLRPPLHPLLHGLLYPVSVCVAVTSDALRTRLTLRFVLVSRQCCSSIKTGNMDKAVSLWFLLLWLGGDSCNLIGSFLANQLPIQVTTSVGIVAPLACVFLLTPALCEFCFHIQPSAISLIACFPPSPRSTQPYTTSLLTL